MITTIEKPITTGAKDGGFTKFEVVPGGGASTGTLFRSMTGGSG